MKKLRIHPSEKALAEKAITDPSIEIVLDERVVPGNWMFVTEKPLPHLTDPASWHIKGTPEEIASIPTYDTRDGLPLFAMSHSDLQEGDPLRTLCDDEPAPECIEAVAGLIQNPTK